ncbi:MAG: phosphate uptake regulator PhoU [Candidatus Thermoplasmatota archaeon]|nr:phosphate uptake regulator PhoU [Candidatus Thermoplasmatota archaeon]
MPIGPGEQDVRKLQLTGGSTYTMSLPKPWILSNNLSARDGIRVDWRSTGELSLTPLDVIEEAKTLVVINLDGIPEGALYDHLMGAYLSGAQEISIQSESQLTRNSRREIRRFLRSTRGFEIGEQSEISVNLISLLNAGELPLHASLNRMYLLFSSLIRDINEVLIGSDDDLISDFEEREREADGLHYLIERQVGSMLDSQHVARSLGLSRKEGVEHANLARSLERMMDHAHEMARLTLETTPRPRLKPDDYPLSLLPVCMEALKSLMINLRTHDPYQIEDARESLKAAQVALKEHEEMLWSGRRQASRLLFEDRISESIRRICAYSRDFGEILLNMIAYDSIQRQ